MEGLERDFIGNLTNEHVETCEVMYTTGAEDALDGTL